MTAEYTPQSDEYEQPLHVLGQALSLIDKEGRVAIIDEDGKKFLRKPHKPVNLKKLRDDELRHRKLTIARSIHGAIIQIRSFPESKETHLQNLAVSLTPYRKSRGFLEEAASLVRVEGGFIYDPYIPPAGPRSHRT